MVSLRRRPSLLLATPLVAGLTVVAAGCGGINQGKLESAIKSQTNDQLEAHGRSARVSSVHCTKKGDGYHFACLLKATEGSTLKVAATCTKGGRCQWKNE